MAKNLTSAEFQALVRSGAIIPTRRGLMTTTDEMERVIGAVKADEKHEGKMQKQMEANDRYLAKKHPTRQKKSSVQVKGFISSNLIATEVKKWAKVGGIFIPYDVASLKNSKQIVPYLDQDGNAKFSLQPSKASLTYKKMASPYWISARERFLEMIKGLKFPLVLGFFFIRKRNSIFDYHNMIQYPMDLMRDFGWIPDDSNLYCMAFPLGHTIDTKCPGVVVIPYKADTIPLIDHPYKKLGFPDAFMPAPTAQTLMIWEGMKKLKPTEEAMFYEEGDESEEQAALEEGEDDGIPYEDEPEEEEETYEFTEL